LPEVAVRSTGDLLPLVMLVTCGAMVPAASGCSSAAPARQAGDAAPLVYVGALSTTDAVVGLEVGPGGWVFYSCGGPTSLETLTHWFSGGPRAADGFSGGPAGGNLELARDGWLLEGHPEESAGWAGTLTDPQGTVRSWNAARLTGDTLSGVYNSIENGCRTGLVLSQTTPGGAIRAQGTWCDGAGHFLQVTPIEPVIRTDWGIHASVSAAGFVRDLYLAPVRVPLQ
jgi:hypothetical protein